MVPRARLLLQEGFSVLLVDLQAHGESPGETITLGLRESGNARSALAWLRSRVPRGRVGVIGTSLGGAAVLLGPQPSGFDAIVLEAVYPDVRTAVQNRVRIRLGPLAPIVAPLLLAQLHPRLGVSPDDLRPITGIPRLGAPVLVVAGQLDRHTTLAESESLYAEAVPPKDLWVVAGARHAKSRHTYAAGLPPTGFIAPMNGRSAASRSRRSFGTLNTIAKGRCLAASACSSGVRPSPTMTIC